VAKTIEMASDLEKGINAQYRLSSEDEVAAKSILSFWDYRKKILIDLGLPNEEAFSNILLFLHLQEPDGGMIWASDVADRFDLPKSIISRYAQMLADVELLKLRYLSHDAVLDLTSKGKMLIKQMIHELSLDS
jgi:predicted transcriptional regulator